MKTRRHAKILELIREHDIETQDELLRHLREAGFDVTQATVSRDIKELRLIKTLSGSGRDKYSTGSEGKVPLAVYRQCDFCGLCHEYAGDKVHERHGPGGLCFYGRHVLEGFCRHPCRGGHNPGGMPHRDSRQANHGGASKAHMIIKSTGTGGFRTCFQSCL